MGMPNHIKEFISVQNKRRIAEIEEQKASKPYDKGIVSSVPTMASGTLWDAFDGKFVLAYTGNTKRIDDLQREFARVGLTGAEIFWNTDDEFAKQLFEACFTDKSYLGRPYKFQFFNNALGHYRIIKGAYARGLQHILVMEDDIRFLRDIDRIVSILGALPADYEVAMLDSHPTDARERKEGVLTGEPVSEFWRKVIYRSSAGCYALNRSGMKKLIAKYEDRPLRNSDDNFRQENFDHIYYCNPCIARQVNAESNNTASVYLDWCWIYDSVGCHREDYGQ